MFAPNVQKQRQSENPGNRSRQEPGARELKSVTEEGVGDDVIPLKLFVIVDPVDDEDVVAVLAAFYRKLVEDA
jgi:hypothetical protein